MPLFSFRCRPCGHEFTELLSAGAVAEASCPQCNSEALERIFQPFAVGTSSSGGKSSCGEAHSCCAGCRHGGGH